MLDIKTKKRIIETEAPIKANKIIEEKVVEEKASNFSLTSGILFVFMIFSITAYVGMISSSVYFAVKESKFAYKSEAVKSRNLTAFSTNSIGESESKEKVNTSRISYINISVDQNISLK